MDQPPFYHIINYRAYEPGTEVQSFTWTDPEAQVVALETAAEAVATFRGWSENSRENQESLRVKGTPEADKPLELKLGIGPAVAASFGLVFGGDPFKAQPELWRNLVLEMQFDDERTVWCPLGDFFSSPNRVNKFRTSRRGVAGSGAYLMVSGWPMPFLKSGFIRIHNLGEHAAEIVLVASVKPWEWDENSMHFHTSWRPDEIHQGDRFEDWNFITIEGRGVLVEDTWTVLAQRPGWWGEGDEKIYVDLPVDATFPTHFGTGTEDYYGWAGGRVPTREDLFSHPFLANISVGSTEADNPRGFNICNRVRGLDAIPFRERLVFDMELSPGTDQRNTWDLLGYSSVVYWYAVPGATSNRPPQPEAALRPLMSLEQLDQRSAQLRAAAKNN